MQEQKRSIDLLATFKKSGATGDPVEIKHVSPSGRAFMSKHFGLEDEPVVFVLTSLPNYTAMLLAASDSGLKVSGRVAA